MKVQLFEDGLYALEGDKWVCISGFIEVIARIRHSDKLHKHGLLVCFKNYDQELITKVIYAKDLNSEKSFKVREVLLDSGYPLKPGNQVWQEVKKLLLEQMESAKPAIIVDRMGWHGEVFATPGWSLGAAAEPHFCAPGSSSAPVLETAGSLLDWQQQVGRLCNGNPIAIFMVGAALAAPLLNMAGMENGAFHLVGASSTGKTTLLNLAASIYGGENYMRSWVSTANGLAAVSAEHNDIALLLDEIGLARPEDVDTAIYQLMNGKGKLRANITGDLAATAQWRTLALSSGEVWVSELLQQIGKKLRAGQQTRFVEIPVFGTYGAFDTLHGYPSAQEFVDALQSSCEQYHGQVIYEWIGLLTNEYPGLEKQIKVEIQYLVENWSDEKMASQVQRVIKRFALVGVALGLACRSFILPWSEEQALAAVRRVLRAWLDNRGHTRNAEEFLLFKALEKAMQVWTSKLVPLDESDNREGVIFQCSIDESEAWLINKQRFLKALELPTHYMREIEILLQRGCLVSNERSRGTYKTKIQGKPIRFFALRPDMVRKYIDELEVDGDEN